MADKLDVRIKKLEVASELTRIMLKSMARVGPEVPVGPDTALTNFSSSLGCGQ